jgi:hypothetical protein
MRFAEARALALEEQAEETERAGPSRRNLRRTKSLKE